MNIKDSFIHLGPGGNNKKALLKDFSITASGITLTRANLLIENNTEVDETLTLNIPIWNLSTTGNAATATKVLTQTITEADFALAQYSGFYRVTPNTSSSIPGATSSGNVAIHAAWDNGSNKAGLDILINDSATSNLYFRARTGAGPGDWKTLLDSVNYTTYVYSKDLGDARYVLKAGDTMTGALTVPSLSVTGAATFSQAINGSILGNAATASRLQNARTISLTGSVTGSGTFDGSGNLSIATTTNHSHSYVNTIGKSGATITWSINGTAQTALDFSTTFAPYNANGYLPLNGGTMTGIITFNSGNYGIKLNTDTSWSDTYRCIPFSNTNDTTLVSWVSSTFAYNPNTKKLRINSSDGGIVIGSGNTGFLKANGTIDSNTYLTSSTNITNIAWTEKSNDANYPVAFSPNITPTTSNNGYNSGFTFNPGTKTFNNNGCRLQYDSTNKVLRFIFD